MRYFLLDLNPACTKPPRILNNFDDIRKKDINLKNCHAIKKRVVFNVENLAGTIFTDIITQPFLLFSQRVMDITRKYAPHTVCKQTLLLDKENNMPYIYFLPILPRIDCISDKSELNNGRTKFIRPVIHADKIKDLNIFWLDKFNSDLPVITLDLAESILRRETKGINLTQVELV